MKLDDVQKILGQVPDHHCLVRTRLRDHWEIHGPKLLEALTNPADTGNCMTCDHQIGEEDMQFCKLGNDTKRACCCYHTKSATQIIQAAKEVEGI